MSKDLPRKLVYLTDNMPLNNTPQKRAVTSVVRDLEAHLKTEAESVSLKELWNSRSPEAVKGEKLYDFLHKVRDVNL